MSRGREPRHEAPAGAPAEPAAGEQPAAPQAVPSAYWERYGIAVQRKAAGGAPGDAGAAVERAAGDGGAPVDAAVRGRVEATTGADLSGVRVHTGAASQEAAAALQARAYTVGHDVHFGAGQYQPGTADGDKLIAHELAHTVQQGPAGGAPQGKLAVSQPHDPAEAEADTVAEAAVASPWSGAFRPTAPSQMMQPQVPIARRAVGAMLMRAPIKGNGYGDWDVEQKNLDAPKAGDPYNSRVTIRFDPNAKTVNATEIAFVQTIKTLNTGGANAWPDATYTKREAKDHTMVDAVTRFGMVGYDNAGKPYSVTPPGEKVPVAIVEPGSSPKPLKSATTRDWPGWNQPNLKWSFETAAVAKAGKDANKIYGAVTWGFDVDKDNRLTAHKVGFSGAASASFTEAVGKWNDQAAGPEADRVAKDQTKLGPFT